MEGGKILLKFPEFRLGASKKQEQLCTVNIS